MAVISDTLGLAYFDITKVGSTSVKLAFWEIDRGAPFEGRGLERIRNALRWKLAKRKLVAPRNIHDMPGYRNERFELSGVPEGYLRFTLLRDPAGRIKSAWRDKINRAQFAWRGEEMDLEAEGLPLDPSFGEFIDHFETYRMTSRPVRVHTTPYAWHIGPDLGFYDRVLRIEAAAEFDAFLAECAGRPVKLPHENSSSGETRDDRLTPAQLDKLFALLAPDYALLAGLYDPAVARAKLAS